jgi:tetratricopeptide (TPR) repeat protein
MAISSQPNQMAVQQLIQLLNNGNLFQAEKTANSLIAQHPDTFILHHVLALALDGQQKFSEAADSYRNAIKLQPNNADLYFNLGITLGHLNQLQEAESITRQAIALNHKFFEAHGNLGTILQRQGRLSEAIDCYQNGLKINPQDARGYFNLGTALRDDGMLKDAVKSYLKAIELFPNYTDAHNNLGETFRDQGNMEAAVKCYQTALSLNPKHANANYNMAEFLYLATNYDEAIPYFERSQLDDWQARSMYCLYKAERFDEFKSKLDVLVKTQKHSAPFLATLSAHYATNFGVDDPYNFCKNGFDFVYQNAITELSEPNSPLLRQLLDDINNTDIAERAQGMLINGKQSAGNLFKRPESSFRTLGDLVKREFLNYRNKFSGAECELIKSFPNELEFTSSWYVRMRCGGYVDKHIHEVGWISGAVYLVLPTRVNSTDGCFEYGLHGDNYPQKHENFPVGIATPNVGDIVLFPSSLFHRTIPFNSNEERICIAFDLKPTVNNGAKSNY